MKTSQPGSQPTNYLRFSIKETDILSFRLSVKGNVKSLFNLKNMNVYAAQLLREAEVSNKSR